MTEIVRIGDATLYHADCRDVLSTLGKFDLLLTEDYKVIRAMYNC